MFLKPASKTFALLGLLLAAGCSSSGGMNNLFPSVAADAIKVESDPPGADVYVMGDKLGVTPLQISHRDVFPNIYPSEKLSLYGRITLKKTGCADITRTVSSEISSNGLHAKLDCGEVSNAPSATSNPAPHIGETVEQRLGKIKELLGKGLISEEEATKAREHILNEL